MKQRIPLYVLTVALLWSAVYLHSPMVVISIVALWAVGASEIILTRKNKDADLALIESTMEKHNKRIEALAHDIRNVQERAKTILGEIY